MVGYLVIKHVANQSLLPDESRALSYFQHVIAPSLLNLDSGSFWSRTALQTCRQEDSLKHLIIAVSLADEQRMCSQGNFPNEGCRHLYHYGKALKLLSSQQKPEVWLILMASLLLCVHEDLQSRGFSALQHIKSGRTILRTYHQGQLLRSGSIHPTASSVQKELVLIFSKLERQTWEFDPETFNGLSLADLCRANPTSEFDTTHGQKLDSYKDKAFPSYTTKYTLQSTLFSWTTAFESLENANRWLYNLRPRCIASQAMAQPPATRFHIVPTITYQLNMWLESLHVFIRLASQTLSEEDYVTISVLRTFQLCLHILSQTFPFHSETLFDKHSHVLEHVIQKLPFYFDLTDIDLAPALWLGATKSRNPAYRRQAVDMLRRADQKPGACPGRGEILARAAEEIIKIEERDLGPVLSCSDVPEQNRMRVFGLELVDERDQLMVLFKKAPHDENAAFNAVAVGLEGINLKRGTDLRLEATLSFDWMALEA